MAFTEEKTKLVFAIFLLVSLVLSSNSLKLAMAADPSVCDTKCGVRCSNAGVTDRCLMYCGLCCQQCNCIPSETYGNKSECPCYRDKLNSKGKPKCP